MEYLACPGDLRGTLATVRSVLLVGLEYFADEGEHRLADPSVGVIARYARGRDYHRVMKAKLIILAARLEGLAGRPVAARVYVDTGPILERDLARRAGLGWFGKSTMLIHPRRGSRFFLGALLLDEDSPSPPTIAAAAAVAWRRVLRAPCWVGTPTARR